MLAPRICPICEQKTDALECPQDSFPTLDLRKYTRRIPTNLVGRTFEGKYKILEVLGQGGMGTVFLAEQKPIGRKVAVKCLNPEGFKTRDVRLRFVKEARVLSNLEHPNTVRVYDFGISQEGILYLVMEYVAGTPLGDVIEASGPMPLQRVVRITVQILRALDEVHAAGVIHRDLKPLNIILRDRRSERDLVKVLDFGIARSYGDEESTSITMEGIFVGTPQYASPEQAMGSKALDGRSDLFCVGVLVYEMLSGHLPFQGVTPVDCLTRIIRDAPRALHDEIAGALPTEMTDFLARSLEKLPEDRYQSASDMIREIARVPSSVMRAQVQAASQSALPATGAARPDPLLAVDERDSDSEPATEDEEEAWHHDVEEDDGDRGELDDDGLDEDDEEPGGEEEDDDEEDEYQARDTGTRRRVLLVSALTGLLFVLLALLTLTRRGPREEATPPSTSHGLAPEVTSSAMTAGDALESRATKRDILDEAEGDILRASKHQPDAAHPSAVRTVKEPQRKEKETASKPVVAKANPKKLARSAREKASSARGRVEAPTLKARQTKKKADTGREERVAKVSTAVAAPPPKPKPKPKPKQKLKSTPKPAPKAKAKPKPKAKPKKSSGVSCNCGSLPACLNFAKSYGRRGRVDLQRACLESALRFAPKNSQARSSIDDQIRSLERK